MALVPSRPLAEQIMRTITLDADLTAKLGDLKDEIALVDTAGNIVACVVPPGHREMLYDMASALFDDEELNRAEREEGGKTTAEVLAHLRSLDDPPAEQGAA
jgi:hypothetical protein